MHCPFCSAVDTKVIDSRLVGEGSSVRRRRQCLVCNERFTTFEVAELVMPRVVKSNDVREPFNEEKLRSGMLKALQKRPLSPSQLPKRRCPAHCPQRPHNAPSARMTSKCR